MKFGKETEVNQVRFEVEMTDEERDFLYKEGLQRIVLDEEAIINYAVNDILREQLMRDKTREILGCEIPKKEETLPLQRQVTLSSAVFLSPFKQEETECQCEDCVKVKKSNILFEVGDQVSWTSQSRGKVSEKFGEIVAVIPKQCGIKNFTEILNLYGSNAKPVFRISEGKRDEESYLILDDYNGKLYHPRVKWLKKLPAPSKHVSTVGRCG